MSSGKPYSIKIFLPGGDPDGIRTVEKSNWSGSGIMFPRPLLADARQRKELSRTGVYVLLGPPEESGLPRIYVGEGDPILPRLDQHARSKDFWTTCIAFSSKDENLNKAHVQYLEARLINLAANAKRCHLDNGNVPQLPTLSEADAADAAGFLLEAMLCFPVLGVSVFSVAKAEEGPEVPLFLRGRGRRAEALRLSRGSSSAPGAWPQSQRCPRSTPYLKEIRASLRANGVLQPEGEQLRFTQNYVFTSPSTAAGVLMGRTANGRTEWRTKAGATLKSIQGGE
ncbi:MAG: GIY-YIG nuclease family protein [Thermoanaerobaculia bacterium]|nr:GIY-YIG nuclease family protein [Thermoanaerobaculia bacterium]